MLVIAKNEDERTLLESDMRDRARESLGNRIRSQMGRAGGLLGGNRMDGAFMKLLDRNRDGALQKSEIPERMRDRLMDIMDTNNDETLDKAEMDSGRQQMEKFLGPKSKGK